MRKDRRGSAFMLFLMLVYVLFIAALIFFVIPNIDYPTAQILFSSPWFLIFQQMLLLLLPLIVWLFWRKEKLNLPIASLDKMNVILIIFICIFIQPGMMLISGLTSLFFPNMVSEVVFGMMQQPYWLLILAVAVTPAICEELVFRGYIQSAYKDIPFKKAALINGLFFAIIHMNLQQFPYAFVMGIIFAYMVFYTRSIYAGILAHFLINASQVTLGRAINNMMVMIEEAGLYMPTADSVAELTFGEQLTALMGFGVIASIATPFAVILFRVFLRHNRRKNIETDISLAMTIESEESEHATKFNRQYQNFEAANAKPKFSLLKSIDPFFVTVIVIFILFVVF